jgi:hypothetical protein
MDGSAPRSAVRNPVLQNGRPWAELARRIWTTLNKITKPRPSS